MELRQIEYFVAVAEHLHFGRAADALSIGQPAVSQQLARLERELGVELIDRTPRTVQLTAAGARFLPEARAVLAALDSARRSVASRSGCDVARRVRLGGSDGLGDRLEAVLGVLQAQQPPVHAELVTAPPRARLERVAAGQLDAAFVRGVTSAPGVELIEVWQDRVLVALPATHPLADCEIVPMGSLAGLPLRIVERRTNPPLVDLVLGACADAGFTPALAQHPGRLEHMLAALAVGPPTWTVIYEAHARSIRHASVSFRRTDPPMSMATLLAVAESATTATVAPLLRACAAVGQSRVEPER
ncbi:MAG TPA: LysR family transcriptional regulator [Jatrophihabitantaceae bacterium]|nr:LysR family transcriptional regulator [Jatrophihabitantaceae bacterium]